MIWIGVLVGLAVGSVAGILWERSHWKRVYRRGMAGDAPTGPYIVCYDDMEVL